MFPRLPTPKESRRKRSLTERLNSGVAYPFLDRGALWTPVPHQSIFNLTTVDDANSGSACPVLSRFHPRRPPVSSSG